MWTRKELKERAKKVFQMNYWKTVLIALIMVLVIGGGGSAAGSFGGGVSSGITSAATGSSGDARYDEADLETGWGIDDEVQYDGGDYSDDEDDGNSSINIELASAAFLGIFAVILLIILAAALAIDILLLNPLAVGAYRFFNRNLHEKGQIRELVYAFDNGYLNIVKIMFFKKLYEFLWTLLLIVPGIVKSYEYRMIPYLLSEHPEMSKEEAFARSKELMMGNKWKTFVLDLSFLPWHLVSAITLGIVGFFYVNPYVYQTDAALYDALKTEHFRNDNASFYEEVPENTPEAQNYYLDVPETDVNDGKDQL